MSSRRLGIERIIGQVPLQCPRSKALYSCHVQVWQDAASLQSAYALGEKESTAAFNLLREIDADAVQRLSKLVQ